jgi:general secretion pathway protein G
MILSGNQRKGYSLVEIVIVLVVLGIIAAIAIPRISLGSKQAEESALRSNLKMIRCAIEKYQSDHGGFLPGEKGDGQNAAGTAASFIRQLCFFTAATGEVSETRDLAHPFGPYLRGQLPRQTVGSNADDNSVTVINNTLPLNADGSTAGWIYNVNTGDFVANTSEVDTAGTEYDDY